MVVEILFLGPACDHAGSRSARITLEDGATVSDLRRALEREYPSITAGLASCRVALNESFVNDEAVIRDGDVAAVIPPVSGGTGDPGIQVALCENRLTPVAARAYVGEGAGHGAVVVFEGVTRDESDPDHGRLEALDYEAYASMAESQMRTLARRARDDFGAMRVAVHHRIGVVPRGETSVVVAVAAAHRAEAFRACSWLMDALKKDVPIWKADLYEDGHRRWVAPPEGKRQGGPVDGSRDGTK